MRELRKCRLDETFDGVVNEKERINSSYKRLFLRGEAKQELIKRKKASRVKAWFERLVTSQDAAVVDVAAGRRLELLGGSVMLLSVLMMGVESVLSVLSVVLLLHPSMCNHHRTTTAVTLPLHSLLVCFFNSIALSACLLSPPRKVADEGSFQPFKRTINSVVGKVVNKAIKCVVGGVMEGFKGRKEYVKKIGDKVENICEEKKTIKKTKCVALEVLKFCGSSKPHESGGVRKQKDYKLKKIYIVGGNNYEGQADDDDDDNGDGGDIGCHDNEGASLDEDAVVSESGSAKFKRGKSSGDDVKQADKTHDRGSHGDGGGDNDDVDRRDNDYFDSMERIRQGIVDCGVDVHAICCCMKGLKKTQNNNDEKKKKEKKIDHDDVFDEMVNNPLTPNHGERIQNKNENDESSPPLRKLKTTTTPFAKVTTTTTTAFSVTGSPAIIRNNKVLATIVTLAIFLLLSSISLHVSFFTTTHHDSLTPHKPNCLPEIFTRVEGYISNNDSPYSTFQAVNRGLGTRKKEFYDGSKKLSFGFYVGFCVFVNLLAILSFVTHVIAWLRCYLVARKGNKMDKSNNETDKVNLLGNNYEEDEIEKNKISKKKEKKRKNRMVSEAKDQNECNVFVGDGSNKDLKEKRNNSQKLIERYKLKYGTMNRKVLRKQLNYDNSVYGRGYGRNGCGRGGCGKSGCDRSYCGRNSCKRNCCGRNSCKRNCCGKVERCGSCHSEEIYFKNYDEVMSWRSVLNFKVETTCSGKQKNKNDGNKLKIHIGKDSNNDKKNLNIAETNSLEGYLNASIRTKSTNKVCNSQQSNFDNNRCNRGNNDNSVKDNPSNDSMQFPQTVQFHHSTNHVQTSRPLYSYNSHKPSPPSQPSLPFQSYLSCQPSHFRHPSSSYQPFSFSQPFHSFKTFHNSQSFQPSQPSELSQPSSPHHHFSFPHLVIILFACIHFLFWTPVLVRMLPFV